MTDTLIWLHNIRKVSTKCLLILSVKMIYIFGGFDMANLIKLANRAGVMHEADHDCSVRSTL